MFFIGFILATTNNAARGAETDENRITAQDFLDAAGILAWRIEVPEDLKDGEYLSLDWTFSTVSGEKSCVEPGGLEIRDPRPGDLVKVFVWLRPWVDQQGEGLDGMKTCPIFQEPNGETRTQYGTLKIPRGFVDLNAHQATSSGPDGGWLMMMVNPDADDNRNACFLDFSYRSTNAKN